MVVAVLAPRLLLLLLRFNSFAIVATAMVAAVAIVALKRFRSSGSAPPSGAVVVLHCGSWQLLQLGSHFKNSYLRNQQSEFNGFWLIGKLLTSAF